MEKMIKWKVFKKDILCEFLSEFKFDSEYYNPELSVDLYLDIIKALDYFDKETYLIKMEKDND